jgi:hypothetical protein
MALQGFAGMPMYDQARNTALGGAFSLGRDERQNDEYDEDKEVHFVARCWTWAIG